jgi:hypothetical protein
MHRGMRRWRRGWAEEGEDQEAHRSWWAGHPFRSSGNRAFDESKHDLLRGTCDGLRLEYNKR